MGKKRTATTRSNGRGSATDHRKTVHFALDDVDYEIDLPPEDAAALRAILSRYAMKGRKTTPRRSRAKPSSPSSSRMPPSPTPPPSETSGARSQEDPRLIRAWAAENGHNPSPRGRIAQSVVDAYNARPGS